MADLSSLLGAAGIGGAIGKAIVSLELDTKKYQAELKGAQAQTVGSTNAMASSTSKFGGLAKTAFLGAGVAVAAFAAYSVNAAIEAADAHLKLQNTFKNSANLSDSSVEAFERQADSLRDLTGVDDEAIISSQALLGQFDLTGQQVLQLIPRIVDLSAKMGIDLEAATKAVGKATQGNAGILSRYGIILDEAGLKADAFGTTLDGIGVAAGFAAARADNEPWRVLGAQFEEVAEQLGNLLLPIIRETVEALKHLVPILKLAADNLDVIVAVLIGFAAFKYLPGLLLNIAAGLEAVGAASLANGLLSVAAGLSGVAASFAAAAVPALAFAGALTLGTAALVKFDPAHILPSAEAFNKEIEDGTIKVGRFNDAVIYGKTVLSLQGDEIDEAAKAQGHLNFEATRGAYHQRQMADALAEAKDGAKKAKQELVQFTLALDESAQQTIITRKEFIHSTNVMQREAENLNTAFKRIAKEDWVNPDYVKFLSEQGPEWVIGFSKLTEDQQHIAQKAWKDSTEQTDNAQRSLERITGVLDKLDKGESKHTVIIEYVYQGYDPSKPGMSGSPQQR